jgi:phage tail sheath protein FI
MAFQVSPGVLVTEKDLTTVIPAVSVSIGAFAGFFKWGPLNDIQLVSTEDQLAKRFGKPDDDTATSFFTAANFLAYGIRLKVVRVADAAARNADSNGDGVRIENDDDYATKAGSLTASFVARHPGVLGNSLRVSVCTSADAFKTTLSNTFTGTRSTKTITVSGDLTDQIVVGSILRDRATGQQRSVVAISAGSTTTTITVDRALDKNISGQLELKWEFADVCGVAPATSQYAETVGGSNDELHVVVVDTKGSFSGAAGTILERFVSVSKASDAKKEDASTNYYVDVINNASEYIRVGSHVAEASETWGTEAADTDFTDIEADIQAHNLPLSGGVDGAVSAGSDERIAGYDLFKNSDAVDLSFVLLGEATPSTAQYVINNICETRKDCVAFVSPEYADVVDNRGNETESVKTFREALNVSSSYAVLDSGWKRQYDKYNDKMRWIPLNGDIAGLCARTDDIADPWYSPAGYNRGGIKNVVKLAWSPTKFERDELYVNGINPVITAPGQGTVLFGDKTLLGRPSAFDRLNVRRLFIVLEKAIASAARFTLFEFNDTFTREQFRNLIEPYLRTVKARRGIYDFKVVCDESNNPAEVIDRNDFVGDIYIKPARSINTIQLNFVAVRTGVEFSEIVGKA